MDSGLSVSVTAVGAASSSVIVSVAVPEVRSGVLPVSITVSSPSARLSPVGSNDRVVVALIRPAGIVTVKSLMAG